MLHLCQVAVLQLIATLNMEKDTVYTSFLVTLCYEGNGHWLYGSIEKTGKGLAPLLYFVQKFCT